MKFYRNERIKEIAEQRLREFEGKLGRPLSIPVDIELFGDLVLGLSMLWENIDELPGEEVLAGLRPADRLIVMNERRKLEMERQAGRRRLTQGHEMGHWDLFVDISKLDHPGLFADAAPSLKNEHVECSLQQLNPVFILVFLVHRCRHSTRRGSRLSTPASCRRLNSKPCL